jgi:hypothetical protein
MWSIAELLERGAPRLDAIARSGSTRSRLVDMARALPAALSRRIYLEVWLGQLRPRIDLIAKVEASERDLLAGKVASPLDGSAAAELGWERLAAFGRAWSEPGSRLDTGVKAVWLEFDLDPTDPDASMPAPRIFVDFHREAHRHPSVEARLDLARDVLRLLAGAERLEAAEPLRACLLHLPRAGTMPYLGVFAGADGELTLRACITGLAADLPQYMATIGWPGDSDALAQRVLGPLSRSQPGGAHPAVVQLEVAPRLDRRIGLEYAFARPGRPGLSSEASFLAELVRRGWCTADNREAVESWPDQSIELLPHDVWHSRVARQLAHVKVVVADMVVAKAYLRLAFDLLPGGTLIGSRPRLLAPLADGAPALSRRAGLPSGGGEPTAPVAQPRDRALDRPRQRGGTRVAGPRIELSGGMAMMMSSAQQEALEKILTRAGVDVDFRRGLLADPRKAILDAFGVRIPSDFRVKFIERGRDVDALIVLPDLRDPNGELCDGDLDAVAGGIGEPDPDPEW